MCVCVLQCAVDGVAESEVGQNVKYHPMPPTYSHSHHPWGDRVSRWQGTDHTHAHSTQPEPLEF